MRDRGRSDASGTRARAVRRAHAPRSVDTSAAPRALRRERGPRAGSPRTPAGCPPMRRASRYSAFRACSSSWTRCEPALVELFQADAHDLGFDGGKRFDSGDRRDDVLLDALVREQDDVGLLLALGGLLLDHRVDRDLAIRENPRDVSENPGLVFHAQP